MTDINLNGAQITMDDERDRFLGPHTAQHHQRQWFYCDAIGVSAFEGQDHIHIEERLFVLNFIRNKTLWLGSRVDTSNDRTSHVVISK